MNFFYILLELQILTEPVASQYSNKCVMQTLTSPSPPPTTTKRGIRKRRRREKTTTNRIRI